MCILTSADEFHNEQEFGSPLIAIDDQRQGMQQLVLFERYLQANDAYLEAIGTDTEYAKKFARKNALDACLEAGFNPVS
jgi:hypothetical protein